jgi:Fic family protein
MAEGQGEDRHSKAHAPELISDPAERAEREAKNALVQFDIAKQAIEQFTMDGDRPFSLRPSLIMSLHRAALDGLSEFAGVYRPAGVEIGKSKHQPPGAHQIPELVEEFCDYVNKNWDTQSAVHLAAYVMWRLNWIHPFDDGNGRTSRAVSYVVLCVRTGQSLPGTYTIPEQISENKSPYYKALEAADAAWKNGQVDVSQMEALMGDMLARQLADILNKAKNPEPNEVNTDRTLH